MIQKYESIMELQEKVKIYFECIKTKNFKTEIKFTFVEDISRCNSHIYFNEPIIFKKGNKEYCLLELPQKKRFSSIQLFLFEKLNNKFKFRKMLVDISGSRKIRNFRMKKSLEGEIVILFNEVNSRGFNANDTNNEDKGKIVFSFLKDLLEDFNDENTFCFDSAVNDKIGEFSVRENVCLLDNRKCSNFCFYQNDVIFSLRVNDNIDDKSSFKVFKINREKQRKELLWDKTFKSRISRTVVIEKKIFYLAVKYIKGIDFFDDELSFYLIDQNGNEKNLNYTFKVSCISVKDVFVQQEKLFFVLQELQEEDDFKKCKFKIDVVDSNGRGKIGIIDLSSILDVLYIKIIHVEEGKLTCFYMNNLDDDCLKEYTLDLDICIKKQEQVNLEERVNFLVDKKNDDVFNEVKKVEIIFSRSESGIDLKKSEDGNKSVLNVGKDQYKAASYVEKTEDEDNKQKKDSRKKNFKAFASFLNK